MLKKKILKSVKQAYIELIMNISVNLKTYKTSFTL